MANTNVPLVDLPFFELCNQAPAASSGVAGLTTAEDGSDRFIYYLSGSNFYRYDTIADTWQTLASPNTTPVNLISLRYASRRGFHGRVISATSSTITIPAMRGDILDGKTINIEFGAGQGQERTLTYQGQTIHDAGVATTANATLLTDSTKKWRVNQWAGYTVGIYYNNDATHYRKIIYNDSTSLYVVDANLQPHDPWNNQVYANASPYLIPSAGAGAQANFMIISSTFSVDTPWSVTPNSASYFTTRTGGVYLLSGSSAAPFFTLQYYDVINDIWQTKTTPQNLLSSQLQVDGVLERTSRVGAAYITKTVTSATARTLTDSTLSLARDRYANYRIYISSGTGIGQSRRIVANTPNTFTIPKNWDITPDATSTYQIWPDYDRIYMASPTIGGSILSYSIENDYWMQGQSFDDGLCSNISATLGSWLPIGVAASTRIAAGIITINTTPTAGGTGYSIGDVLTCAVGGAGAQVRVTSIAPGGIVTGIELINSGTTTGYTVGTGRATTGGAGTGCTIEITSVGPTATIGTATNHFFRTGDVITFAGCTEAAWNTAHTIIGVPSTASFCVAVTATANMTATATQSATLLVDPTKNWIVNEHVGRLLHVTTGTGGGSQVRWISANTSNTITIGGGSFSPPTSGTTKYVIYDSKVFGIDVQRKESGMEPSGWATGGSTTTLIDSTKNWVPNQWAGYVFRIEAGTGYGNRITIVSNTETTLTYATQAFTPDATTKYEIADCWGLASAGALNSLTDSTKNWSVNQWGGKRIRYTGGAALGNDVAISSNTANAITTASSLTADTTTTYAIVGIPARAAGCGLVWVWGDPDSTKNGRYIYSPRGGGSNQIDIYDIASGRWEYGLQFSPQGELFNTGSSYAYEGGSSFFASRSATSTVFRILEVDPKRRVVTGKATTTNLQGAVHTGNFLEIVEANGNKFMYYLQNAGAIMARCLLF